MLKEILKELIVMAVPGIKALIASKVVPAIKRKAYERFDDFANDSILSLAKLKEKAEKTEDPVKKAAHLEGLKLGAATIKAIGKKLVKGADKLLEQ